MRTFAEVCEAIAATSKKSEKIRLVAQYFKTHSTEDSAIAALFFSGRPFPANQNLTLQIGGALLGRMVAHLCVDESLLYSAYRKHGDLGSAAFDVLPQRSSEDHSVSLAELQDMLQEIARTPGPKAKSKLLEALLVRSSPLEAKYLIKLISGDLRIGLKESLVEESIASCCAAEVGLVRRVNMLLGNISETMALAATGGLAAAQHSLRLFRPIGVMLASPVDTVEEAANYLSSAVLEDKYDGIRAQVHSDGTKVKIFSRTLDDITSSFPDIAAAVLSFPSPLVVDGEIVGWEHPAEISSTPGSPGRASTFSSLQTRIGRKKVTGEMIRNTPVALVVFDVLYSGSQLWIDHPLWERLKELDDLFARKMIQGQFSGTAIQAGLDGTLPAPPVIRTTVRTAKSVQELEEHFTAAQAAGNEGLMIKDLNSTYAVGRRGGSWLKLKKALASLDVVVTAAEYGHGKRASVLSDYTFAVQDGDRLLNVGKAYSGLTNAEIAQLTDWFLEHIILDEGHRLLVKPSIVLEVAFNNVMKSARHESGYALRFPRILRLRPDKTPSDIDTVDRVAEIFELQHRLRKPQVAHD